jgi:hypothetical protein
MPLASTPSAASFPNGAAARPDSPRLGGGANGTGEQGAETCSIVFQTFHSRPKTPPQRHACGTSGLALARSLAGPRPVFQLAEPTNAVGVGPPSPPRGRNSTSAKGALPTALRPMPAPQNDDAGGRHVVDDDIGMHGDQFPRAVRSTPPALREFRETFGGGFEAKGHAPGRCGVEK